MSIFQGILVEKRKMKKFPTKILTIRGKLGKKYLYLYGRNVDKWFIRGLG
jgi:hypothetical protein